MRSVALYVVKRWAFRLSLIVAGLVLAWLLSIGDALAVESPAPSPTPTPTPIPTPTPTPAALTVELSTDDRALLGEIGGTVQVASYAVVFLLAAALVVQLRPR